MPSKHQVVIRMLKSTLGPRVCVWTEHVIAWYYMHHSLYFDMQHDHILKSLNLASRARLGMSVTTQGGSGRQLVTGP